MLTLEQVAPTCKYWANKYTSRYFEFNELFNVAYLIAINQKTVLTLQKAVKGALLRFMINRQKFTSQCRPFENESFCAKEKCLQSMANKEELLKIISEAHISQCPEFLEILRLRFVEKLTGKEIAKKFNVSQQVISNRYNIILDSLIFVNERRKNEKCIKV